MQLNQIYLKDIKPFVRFVQRYYVPSGCLSETEFKMNYDHRLFYVRHGSGYIEFIDEKYAVSRGDLVFWPSGWQYRMRSDNSEQRLVLLGCNFDYTQANTGYSYPVPPDTVDKFRTERIFENLRIAECRFSEAPICLHNMQAVEADLEEMLREYNNQLNLTADLLSGMMLKILCILFRQVITEDRSYKAKSNLTDEIIKYIQAHYAEELSNELIGELFNYHPNYINRLMVHTTGKSLHQYILDYRIKRAIDLITTTDDAISSIAMSVGFNDIPHFIRLFKQRTGITPNKYRKNG